MSTTVDQRVVEMRFDNRHFEQNVSTTLSSLDKLKQGLNLTGATKGLEDIDSASKKITMTSMGDAVDSIGVKFNALWTIADQALRNITNSVWATAKNMVSALTIDPITAGFSEYETQIGAVQTILANTESKGTTLQDVNRALDELNSYADKTIYNFTEMTRNIGTFTAAGIDLDTSVNAIQGIANLAAVSGSTSQQASTAMYQLSQALSSGTVKLMDWNSVVNAGMGGQVFQDALKATARVMAQTSEDYVYDVDEIIEASGSFRESLSEGWVTAEVLTETLSHFTMAAEEGTAEWEAYKKSLMEGGYTEAQAEEILKLSNTATDAATKVKTFTQLWDTLKEAAQSGWTQSWEIIVGDFEEAKGFLTDISNRLGAMIGESAEARNEMLSGGLSTGWKQLLNEGIADEEGYKETFKSVAKQHNISIDDMVAAEKKLDESLSDTEAFQRALSTGLKDGTLNSQMFSESVHQMADKMSKMSAEQLKAAGYTVENVEQIKALSTGLKNGSISMDEFTTKMTRASGRENIIESLWNAFNGLMSVIEPVKEAFSEIFPPITGEQLYSFTEALKEFTSKLTLSETASDNLKRTFKGLFAVIDIIKESVVAFFKLISPLLGGMDDLGGGILKVTANWGDWLVNLRDSIKQGNIFGKGVEKIHKVFAKIGEFLSPVVEGIREFGAALSSNFGKIANDAETRLGPLAALGNFIKNIFTTLGNVLKKVAPYVHAVASGIGSVLRSLMDQITSAVQGADYEGLFDVANGGVITAIGIFIAKFIKAGGDLLDNASSFGEDIKEILGGVSDALNAFTSSLKADTLKKIAIAIGILAASLLVLSIIDSEKLTASLGAVALLLVGLVTALNSLTETAGKLNLKGMVGLYVVSNAITSISRALLVLAVALKIMGSMSWGEMTRSLIAMTTGLGALLFAILVLTKLPMGDCEKSMNKAVSMITRLSKALVILAVALKIMGSMSWSEMLRSLIAMTTGLGAMIGTLMLLSKIPMDECQKSMKSAVSMIGKLSAALVILAVALKIMGSMSWSELLKSLVAMAGGLGVLVAAIRLMPKDTTVQSGAIVALSIAMVLLGSALKIMAAMTWEEIAKGLLVLAGSMAILVGALVILDKATNNIVSSAGAILILSAALAILAPSLKSLGSMGWSEVARSLISIAGAFVILGVAAKVLQPLVGTILKLSAALLVFSIACVAIGVGVSALAAGLTAIAGAGSAIAVAIVTIASSLISLIPYLIEQIGVGIVKLLQVISGAGDAIFSAAKVIILSLVDALVACVPAIVEGVFVLVAELLKALADYAPVIISSLFDFLIGILNGIAERLPELIQASVDVLMSFFAGVVDALASIDTTVLINGLAAVGVLGAIVAAMALVAGLVPAAILGVIGMGIVVAELALVLAAIGALSQIKGLDWMIGEGGNLLQAVGKAIGQFLGGIAGGFAQGMSSALPQIGSDLSEFMTNAKTFIDGAKTIDPSMLDGVKSLVGVIAALTAVDILQGLTSWFTGGTSLVKFGEELKDFAPNIRAYADEVAGIDSSAVTASANAAKALAEMTAYIPKEGGMVAWFAGESSISKFGTELVTLGESLSAYSDSIKGFKADAVISSANAATAIAEMTSHIPDSGGMVSWFAGDNSIAQFGTELVTLGESLSAYSKSVTGFKAEAVIASANAAQALADMTSHIPDSGGMVSWFAGDNSIAQFGNELVTLGLSLRAYSMSIAGFNADAVIASANAAQALVDMTSKIPNEGGIVAWFTGENSISKFGTDLVALGSSLSAYSDVIAGFNSEAVIASANAAQALVDMTSTIPNSGGIVAWFTGENSIARFGAELVVLGLGLRGYSNAIAGFNAEAVIASASAARAIAEMANYIPNEGGIVTWFTGENSIARFGTELVMLGAGLSSYSNSIAGFNAEAVIASANAARAIAEMSNYIPNEGGLVAWFTGENSIARFASQLPILGYGLLGFSNSVAGINAETVGAAVSAAKSLAEMSAYIPNEGGMIAWFTGESSIAKFASQLPVLGAGLLGFSNSLAGINIDNITAATSAAKALVEMSASIPSEGGIKAWFSGESSIASFASKLPVLGGGMKKFSDSVSGITPENITAAASSAKTLAQMASSAPENADNLVAFGNDLANFGVKLGLYFQLMGAVSPASIATSVSALTSVKNATTGFEPSNISAAADAIHDMVSAIREMSKINGSSANGFTTTVKKLSETNVDGIINSFKHAGTRMVQAGKELITGFVRGAESQSPKLISIGKASVDKLSNGMEMKKSAVSNTGKTITTVCATTISSLSSRFTSAGKNLGAGLVIGINAKQPAVYRAAYALGQKAVQGEKDGQASNSPSKLTILAGEWLGEGLIIGIDRMGSKVYNAGSELGETATKTISASISKIADAVNSDIDTQPTIRPVLDLSDVRSGANALSGMLDMDSRVGVMANVGSISAMMGTNKNLDNHDVVDAINKLRKDIGNISNTSYTIDGVTYDDGSNIAGAMQTIARAAIRERRI